MNIANSHFLSVSNMYPIPPKKPHKKPRLFSCIICEGMDSPPLKKTHKKTPAVCQPGRYFVCLI